MQSLTCAVEESDFSACFVWIPVESLLQCKYITTIHDLPLKSGFMLVNNPSYIVETTDVCFFFCFIFCFIHLFSPWEIWNGDEFQLQRLPLCSLVCAGEAEADHGAGGGASLWDGARCHHS